MEEKKRNVDNVLFLNVELLKGNCLDEEQGCLESPSYLKLHYLGFEKMQSTTSKLYCTFKLVNNCNTKSSGSSMYAN